MNAMRSRGVRGLRLAKNPSKCSKLPCVANEGVPRVLAALMKWAVAVHPDDSEKPLLADAVRQQVVAALGHLRTAMPDALPVRLRPPPPGAVAAVFGCELMT